MAEEAKNTQTQNVQANNSQVESQAQVNTQAQETQEPKQPSLFDLAQAQTTQKQDVSEVRQTETDEQGSEADVNTLMALVSELAHELEQLKKGFTETQIAQNRSFVEQKVKELGLPKDALQLIDYSKPQAEIEKQLAVLAKIVNANTPKPGMPQGELVGSSLKNAWERFAKKLTSEVQTQNKL